MGITELHPELSNQICTDYENIGSSYSECMEEAARAELKGSILFLHII